LFSYLGVEFLVHTVADLDVRVRAAHVGDAEVLGLIGREGVGEGGREGGRKR